MARSTSATVARWQDRMQRFQQANMTVARFCQQEGVSQASFYLWRKKLGQQNTQQPETPQSAVPTTTFQPLKLIATANVIVELPAGIRIQVPTDQTTAIQTILAELIRDPRTAGGEP